MLLTTVGQFYTDWSLLMRVMRVQMVTHLLESMCFIFSSSVFAPLEQASFMSK